MRHQCCKIIGYANQCDRTATEQDGDKWYCWQHGPKKRKQKAEELKSQAEHRSKQLEEIWARRDKERAAGFLEPGLQTLTDDDLQVIISAGGIAAILKSLRA